MCTNVLFCILCAAGGVKLFCFIAQVVGLWPEKNAHIFTNNLRGGKIYAQSNEHKKNSDTILANTERNLQNYFAKGFQIKIMFYGIYDTNNIKVATTTPKCKAAKAKLSRDKHNIVITVRTFL